MQNTITVNAPSKTLVAVAFAALYIIWGSTYLAIAIAVKGLPPLLLAGIRFFIAGFILYLWCRVQGQSTPDRGSLSTAALSGILMLFFGTGSLVWVEQYIPSGLAAIIIATVPLWFVLLDRQQWRYHFSNKYIITGLLIGFAGVLVLFGGSNKTVATTGKMQTISFFVLLLGSIIWAIGSLYSKYKPSEGSTGMKAAVQMMAAGLVSLLAGLASGEASHFTWSQVSPNVIFAMLYLITFGSLIGYISYVWLLSVKPPAMVGTYAYVNPVVAVFLGWLIAHEQISSRQVLALGIILTGVIIVALSKNRISLFGRRNLAQ